MTHSPHAGTLPVCRECGTELAASFVSCPSCHRLVHGDELKRLAAEARAATDAEDIRGALAAWRGALDLLPPASAQHARVLATVQGLSAQLDAGGVATHQSAPHQAEKHPSRIGAAGVGLAGLALLLWKFKFALAFLLTKGKLLLLGLTKTSTLFSMMLSLGVYWTVWGWRFALGLVLSIYVHEMGHIFALRHYGIRASAPMFIPGLGAMVRLNQYPASPKEDARVGLAGPIWGLAAALAVYAAFLVTGWDSLGAIAKVGAWINLFNLVPVWQLDGSRGFRAMTKPARWLCVFAIAVAWVLTEESLLVLLLIAGLLRAMAGPYPESTDRRAVLEYILLVAALSALTLIPVVPVL